QQERDLAHVAVGAELDRESAGRSAPLDLGAPRPLPARCLVGYLEQPPTGRGQPVAGLMRNARQTRARWRSRLALTTYQTPIVEPAQPPGDRRVADPIEASLELGGATGSSLQGADQWDHMLLGQQLERPHSKLILLAHSLVCSLRPCLVRSGLGEYPLRFP